MNNEHNVRAVAQAFADALDRNDFECVKTMLAPTCRYDLSSASFTNEGTLVGPEAILTSYRWHDARARKLFNTVDYSSVVETAAGLTAVVRFTDVLQKVGQRHSYSCRQHLTIDEQGLIASILHEDIPEESAALRAFVKRVDVAL